MWEVFRVHLDLSLTMWAEFWPHFGSQCGQKVCELKWRRLLWPTMSIIIWKELLTLIQPGSEVKWNRVKCIHLFLSLTMWPEFLLQCEDIFLYSECEFAANFFFCPSYVSQNFTGNKDAKKNVYTLWQEFCLQCNVRDKNRWIP